MRVPMPFIKWLVGNGLKIKWDVGNWQKLSGQWEFGQLGGKWENCPNKVGTHYDFIGKLLKMSEWGSCT